MIRSRRSLQKSKFKLDSSKSHAKNERFAQKVRNFRMYLTVFPLFMPISELFPVLFAPSLFFKKRSEKFPQVAHYKKWPWASCSHRSLQKSNCERYAQVAHDKRASVSDSLTSLFTKERQEQFPFFEERIALLLTKTSELLEKLMSKFPTLLHTHIRSTMHSLVKNTYICEHCIPLLATHCIVW